jgi:hypothetical protein
MNRKQKNSRQIFPPFLFLFFQEEMEKRYKSHQSETEAKIQEELSTKTTAEAEEYEKQLAETYPGRYL